MGGSYLTKPKTDKETTSGSHGGYEYAMSAMQGWRQNMEDAHICDPNFDVDTQLYAVFDGHGGFEVALFAEKHFPIELKANEAYQNKDFPTALKQTFLKIDDVLQSKEGQIDLLRIVKTRSPEQTAVQNSAGCTANVTLIHKGTIYVANAGDSRCVLSCEGKSEDLSKDHKPDDPIELARITKAGGYVKEGRVNGNLNLSRALGDLTFKADKTILPEEQQISAMPDIVERKITAKDEFLLMGCDGIWELKTNQELITICRKGLADRTPMTQIVENLLDQIISKDSTASQGLGCDNMSMILIKLKRAVHAQESEPDKDSIQANGVLDKYKQAGVIADTVVSEIIKLLKPQAVVSQLCALGDQLVETEVNKVYLKDKNKGVAVPTSISINEVIANYAPLESHAQKTVIKKGDVVKVSVGVQIDGFPVESAQTIVVSDNGVVDGKRADVIHAAHTSLQTALRTLNPESTNLDTASIIQKTAQVYKCNLVADVRSNQVKRNSLHSEQFVPSQLDLQIGGPNTNTFHYEQFEVYTLNVTVSTGKGIPLEQKELEPSIYTRAIGKQLSQVGVKKNIFNLFEQIETNHTHFPFSSRLFKDDPVFQKAFQEFNKQQVIIPATVESEVQGELVACFKQTVAISNGGLTLLSGLKWGENPLANLKSNYSAQSVDELKELLERDVLKKKKNKPKKK